MRASMNRIALIAALMGLAMISSACGPKLMMPTTTITDAKPDKALITFVRATKFGYKSDFHIWDSRDYVGTIYGGQYIQKEVDPGEHMFIVHGQNWAYIKATMEPGKKYYILLNVAMGFTHASVVPVMITKSQTEYGQAEIDNWMASLKPFTPNPEGADPFVEKRRPQIEQAVQNGLAPDAKFQYLSAEDYWN